jgi:isoleucyl-tRNA synthetase
MIYNLAKINILNLINYINSFITFPTVNDPETFLVAWTTTPWTLPSNLILAVNPNFVYLKVKDLKTNKFYIIGKDRISAVFPKPELYEVVKELTGEEL